MIIIRYKGGLGNQMFQYAFQVAMQRRYPDEIIKADLSHYLLQPEHNGFELDKAFGIKLDCAGREEVRQITNLYIPSDRALGLPEKLKHRLAVKYQYRITEWNRRFHKEKEKNYYCSRFHNSYEDVVFHLNREHDWYLEGLWQNLNYYTGCLEQIKADFKFPDENRLAEEDKSLLAEIKNTISVGVHVRRGDFVNSKFDICSRAYYKEAMEKLEEELSGISYFFFTDDEEFVRREFADVDNTQIIHHDIDSSILDMQLMSACRHNIISNSTFSYWAALLNGSGKQRVIAPAYSIRNTIGAYELSAPSDWILLEV